MVVLMLLAFAALLALTVLVLVADVFGEWPWWVRGPCMVVVAAAWIAIVCLSPALR